MDSARAHGGEVFISYSHQPRDRSYVDRLASYLSAAGTNVWYDPALGAGGPGHEVLDQRIPKSAAFVMVMSPDAEVSPWARQELERAQIGKRPIVALLLEGRQFPSLVALPFVDVTDGAMPAQTIARYLSDLAAGRPTEHQHRGGVWAVPAPPPTLISRPELTEPVIARVTSAGGATVRLVGPLGSGRSTVARQVCADQRVRARFAEAVWVSIGEQTEGAALAMRVNEVYYRLTRDRPTLIDPDQAGQRLGELLDRRPDVLLILDEVRTAGQLRPFLYGGLDGCSRLIIAEPSAILPADGLDTVDVVVPAYIHSGLSQLERLSDTDRERVVELGVLAGEVDLPRRVLALLWGATGGLSPGEVDALIGALDGVGVLAEEPGDRLRVPDAIHAELRHRGHARFAATNAALVAAARGVVPGDSGAGGTAWWRLPDELEYLWLNLCRHLHEAGHHDELAALVTDLRWIVAKLRRFGPAAVDIDLALATDTTATVLRRALRSNAHLCEPIEPAQALADTLASRLRDVPELHPLVDAYAATMTGSVRLTSRWPMPDRPHPAQIRRLGGHTRAVMSCAVAPDGRWLVTTGEDHTVRIWDVATGGLRHLLTGHRQKVISCAIALDGTWLVTASADQTARIWDAATGRCRHLLAGHAEQVVSCAIAPEGSWLVTTSRDWTARIWDAATGEPRALLQHPNWVSACAIAPDGRWLVTTGDDAKARIWDTETGVLQHTLTGHWQSLTACAIAPDGRWLATTSGDGTARVWDPETGALRHTLTGHTNAVTSCVAAPDSTWLATASQDHTARIWDIANGTPRHTLTGHWSSVERCAVAPHGAWLATTGGDGTARVWDVASGTLRHTLTGHFAWVMACAIAPNGRWLVTGGNDYAARIWDPDAPALRHPIIGHVTQVSTGAVAPDGRWVATTPFDGTALLWDGATEALRHTLTGHTRQIRSFAVAPDGSWLVSAGLDGTARIWDTATGRLRHQLAGHTDRLHGCAIAPDGTWLVTTSADDTGRIWDTATGTVRHVLSNVGATCAIAPDGGWLVATDGRGEARIWDAATGAVRHPLTGHDQGISACAIAADGTWLVTGSNDRTARIWDAATGTPRHTLVGHTAPVSRCAIAPDGRWLATISGDGTACIWDPASGTLRHRLTGHTDRLSDCAITPDGRWLATAGADRTVRIWDTDTGAPVTAIRVNARDPLRCAFLPDTTTLAVVAAAGAYLFDLGQVH
jgi:WD40 repeat protein